MPARSAYPTPPPIGHGAHSGGLSAEVIAVHLSYLVAQVTALVPKVDALHDASVRRDSEVYSLRSKVGKITESLDEHSDLHKAHSNHLSRHCDEIDDLNKVAAGSDEPKSWVGKLGAKAIDALIPMLMTIVFFGALAGWTGVKLQWGNPVQEEKTSTTTTTKTATSISTPTETNSATKPAAQGAP